MKLFLSWLELTFYGSKSGIFSEYLLSKNHEFISRESFLKFFSEKQMLPNQGIWLQTTEFLICSGCEELQLRYWWKSVLLVLLVCKSVKKNTIFKTIYRYIYIFSIRVFFHNTDDSHDSRGREGTMFYSTLPLPPAHEHSDTYLQLCMWDDYHIFLIATLVFTRLILNEMYHLIELPFDWLMMLH